MGRELDIISRLALTAGSDFPYKSVYWRRVNPFCPIHHIPNGGRK
jgi:hypothetical protein